MGQSWHPHSHQEHPKYPGAGAELGASSLLLCCSQNSAPSALIQTGSRFPKSCSALSSWIHSYLWMEKKKPPLTESCFEFGDSFISARPGRESPGEGLWKAGNCGLSMGRVGTGSTQPCCGTLFLLVCAFEEGICRDEPGSHKNQCGISYSCFYRGFKQGVFRDEPGSHNKPVWHSLPLFYWEYSLPPVLAGRVELQLLLEPNTGFLSLPVKHPGTFSSFIPTNISCLSSGKLLRSHPVEGYSSSFLSTP